MTDERATSTPSAVEIHCTECNYNLRGVLADDRSGTCPECGRVFNPGELKSGYSVALDHFNSPSMLVLPVLLAVAVALLLYDLAYICMIIPIAYVLALPLGIYCSVRHALKTKY